MDDVQLAWGSGGLGVADLERFFVGWPTPPPGDERVRIVAAADEVVVARDSSGVIGFATALTDGRFSAYIPLVEVVPDRHGEGIGSRMIEAMLERLAGCYMIDLVCDADVVPFYERLGGTRIAGIAWRDHDRLSADSAATEPTHGMSSADALAVVDALTAAGVDVCLAGGWSVDALLGRQTRPHQDLDLWLPAAQFVLAVPVCAELGIDRLFPWGDERPWNFVLHDGASRRLDLHMYEPVGDGMFHYGDRDGGDELPLTALAGEGTIDGRPVRCESAEWCVRFHTGYEPRPEDHLDVPLLCERFDIELPSGFAPGPG